MSEEPQVSGVSAAAESGPTGSAGLSAGAMLRRIRETANVDAAIVASVLKISPQTLQALEQDRYDALPDMAFARGLASSICRNFGVDPAPVLAQMPQALAFEPSAPKNGINAPFYSPSDRSGAILPKYISRPLTVVVALFLLGSLLLWLWPTLPVRLGDTPADVQTTALQDPSVADAGEEESVTETTDSPVTEPSPGDVPLVVENTLPAAGGVGADADASADDAAGAADTTPDAEGVSSTTDSGSGAADAAIIPDDGAEADAGDEAEHGADDGEAAVAASEADAVDEDLVIEAASDESWVSVHDRSGRALFNRLLEQGETARVSGDKPLSVTVGRKNAVTVLVHGEPFDHRSLSNSSVSRFKVE